MKIDKWLGIVVVLISIAIAITTNVYQDSKINAFFLYFGATLLFAIGIVLMLGVTAKDLFFIKSNKPDIVYRPEFKQILVKFGSLPFEIERDGLKLRLVMMRRLPYNEVGMYVCEPNQGLDYAFVATGLENGKEATFGLGQILHFARQTVGIKVWWAEENNPWKLVDGKNNR